LASGSNFCNILKIVRSQNSHRKLFSAHTFHAMSLFIVCVVTTTVRHTADFRTQTLNGIEIVGAGVKSGNLASGD